MGACCGSGLARSHKILPPSLQRRIIRRAEHVGLHLQGHRVFFQQRYPLRVEEVASLKRELARVKKERDFLREAATFFAMGST